MLYRCLIVLLTILCIYASANAAETISPPGHHYTLTIPEGWAEWKETPYVDAATKSTADIIAYPSSRSGPAPILTVVYDEHESLATHPESFAAGVKLGTARSAVPAGLSVARNDAAFDPITHRVVADFELQRGTDSIVHTRSIYVPGGKSFLNITMVSLSKDFDTNEAILKGVADSVRFDAGWDYSSRAAGVPTPALTVASLGVLMVTGCGLLGLALLAVVAVLLIVRKAQKTKAGKNHA